ncbi:hypothetical protein ACFYR1_44420 [Streptomyces canus]|uniref:hypothetical protein n=1 Tax=Streptomyces canus TaxID=58343 RepID=UPI0036C49706
MVQGSCDDEASQALTLHAGGDGHPADAHHRCLGVADRDTEGIIAVARGLLLVRFEYWGSRTTCGAAADRLSDMPSS